MEYNTLRIAAQKVIDAIDTTPPQYTSKNILTSIKNQMIFIRDNAAAGKNPSKELASDTTFTYSILSSRELASPDELVLKELIDDVTRILRS
ncbi:MULTISPECIES: hypothetical protein [unclassified Cellvibrio]|jgi:hypothetical protein|uniref:hypothetical protein n=1 Tax=unclassified Cellvibrio TaxID=2624793 RepID=UPI00058E2348|nr:MULTISPECIES: hypothetical protein [unclassified Cellvibrio]UUA72875.1 hypothetical protein NNX04_00125 [Cellvibrio sp. QJXJ]